MSGVAVGVAAISVGVGVRLGSTRVAASDITVEVGADNSGDVVSGRHPAISQVSTEETKSKCHFIPLLVIGGEPAQRQVSAARR